MLSALTTPGNTHENTANINNILVAVEKSDKNKKGKYALRVSTESDRRQQRKTRVTRAKFVGITKQNSRFVEDVNANADADVLAEEEEESEEEEEEEECRRIFFIFFFSLAAKVCWWWWLVVAVSLFCEEDDVGNSKRKNFVFIFSIFFCLRLLNVEDKGEKRKREKQEKE